MDFKSLISKNNERFVVKYTWRLIQVCFQKFYPIAKTTDTITIVNVYFNRKHSWFRISLIEKKKKNQIQTMPRVTIKL